MAKKKKKSDPPAGCPAWLATYGDMVTLVLTFFVLLFSFSTIDAAKWKSLVTVFSGGSGVLSEQTVAIPRQHIDVNTEQVPPEDIEDSDFNKLYQEIKQQVAESDLERSVEVTKNGDEILVRFQDSVLFDLGSADLKPESMPILNSVGDIIKNGESSVLMLRVEGHTDNLPISTSRFPTNWELSTMRAVCVLRFMVETKAFDKTKVSAVGYGEMHPIAANDNPDGRAKNRRVDFVIRSNEGAITPLE